VTSKKKKHGSVKDMRAAVARLDKLVSSKAERGELPPPSSTLAAWRTRMGVACVKTDQGIRRIRRGSK
jgi:hypothetical protein